MNPKMRRLEMPNLLEIVHVAFAGITLIGGLTLAFTRNIIYATFMLFVVLFGVAGLYVFYGAEFLAISQIIVYVGGILVILLFGVMLTHKLKDLRPRTEIVNLIPGFLIAGGLFSLFVAMVAKLDFNRELASETISMGSAAPVVADNVEKIGVGTLTEYLLPFEIVSVLLLVVLIGAAYLSRRSKDGKEAAS